MIRWTEAAVADLEAISEYIALDSPAMVVAWIERLEKRALAAAEAPLAGRIVPELGREDIREVLLRSHRIVYRVVADGIEVLTVFEGHRSFRSDEIDE